MDKDAKDELAAAKARLAAEQAEAAPAADAPEADLKKDGRALTSAENGKKGGRKPQQTNIANAFIMTQGEPFPFRRHCRRWYRFNSKIWEAKDDEEVGGHVMGYLRQVWPASASINMRNNVLGHMTDYNVALVDGKVRMPCWLPDGESAADWRAMGNCLVNVRKLAEGASPKAATMPFTPRLFSTFGVDYDFDPAAKCPRWMSYLDDVQPNAEDRLALQMLFGLCLVPDTSYDVFFLFYGDGGTGKSVAGRVLEALVGKANVSNLTLADFAEKHAVHMLTESLVNWVSDMPRLRSDQLQAVEGILKQSTGGEGLKVERKNENPGKAPATARCIFATNNLPEFTDQSFGLWRRMRIIPFEQRIVGTTKQDRGLAAKLIEELPGIFLWAVEGLGALLKAGAEFPLIGRGKAIYEEHRGLCDRSGTFIRERYRAVGGSAGIETGVVYAAYKTWSEDNGYRPKGMNLFVADMRRVYPGVNVIRQQIGGERKRIFAGLELAEMLDFGSKEETDGI